MTLDIKASPWAGTMKLSAATMIEKRGLFLTVEHFRSLLYSGETLSEKATQAMPKTKDSCEPGTQVEIHLI